MKYLILAALILTLSACSTFEKLGDYVKENPLVASVSFRYATAKYIDGGKTDADKTKRKDKVLDVASKVKAFIETNPTLTIASVMQYLDEIINWGSLDPADRVLIQEILKIVQSDLQNHKTQNPLVNVIELLDTIISAATLYRS